MKKEDVLYGINLGYKLGRLEFLWNISEGKSVKDDVAIILEQKGKRVEGDSYPEFVNAVLNCFSDDCVFSTILVGIGGYRNILAKKTDKEELNDLARSAFETIPEEFIANPMKLYAKFDKESPETVENMVDLTMKYLSEDDLFF